MLNKDNMRKLTDSHVIFSVKDELHNMQIINERLLRTAVKNCEDYSTDMLILINTFENAFLKEGETECDIWFRSQGVEWEWGSGKKVFGKPDLYRQEMKLVLDEHGSLTLYQGHGNC